MPRDNGRRLVSYDAGSGTLDVAAVMEPDTRLTAGPTKTTKPEVKFAFTSDDPVATHECQLTGKRVSQVQVKTFQPCASPKKYKHLRPGRYTLSVRATDALGNVETTPATLRLKVKPR